MSKAKNSRAPVTGPQGGTIPTFFTTAAAPREDASKMAQTRSSSSTPCRRGGRAGMASSQAPERLLDAPDSPEPSPQPQSSENSQSWDSSVQATGAGVSEASEWRALIQTLPTKADLDRMADAIVLALRQEVQEVQRNVQALESKIDVVESAHSDLSVRVTALEAANSDTQQRLTTLFLHQDDTENRSRRNNLRLKGIPEASSGSDLRATVTAILNRMLDRNPTADLELDRVHRVQMFRENGSDIPRDVLCRVHFFVQKEEILRRAWRQGPLDFDGATVQIMPDLSRHTLRMRRILRPLLEVIRSAGATYRWGHPFHLILQRDDQIFTLHTPNQLPALFHFLNIPAIDIPNWLDFPVGPVVTDRQNSRSSSRFSRPAGRRQRAPPLRPTPIVNEP